MDLLMRSREVDRPALDDVGRPSACSFLPPPPSLLVVASRHRHVGPSIPRNYAGWAPNAVSLHHSPSRSSLPWQAFLHPSNSDLDSVTDSLLLFRIRAWHSYLPKEEARDRVQPQRSSRPCRNQQHPKDFASSVPLILEPDRPTVQGARQLCIPFAAKTLSSCGRL